jgi:uncharacterized protein (TIGR00297 family)
MPTVPPVPHLLLAMALALCIAGAAKAVRALSWSGMVAATVVGFALFGFGGMPGAVALLLFFVTSSALSRVGKRRKEALAFEKGGERDAGQVLANGGVATLMAFLLPCFPNTAWPVVALLGALATANADTWATEIGSLAKGKPRRITDLRPAETGESGAISVQGTLAAVAGATLLAGIAFFWGLSVTGFVAVTVGGVFGSLVDSLLGATIQEQFHDPYRARITERRLAENGTPLVRVRGLRGVNNDLVNCLATAAGALLSVFLYGILR